MVLVAVLAFSLRLYLSRLNKKAAQGYGKIWEEGEHLVHNKNKAMPFKFML
jgi:hypothetical protein